MLDDSVSGVEHVGGGNAVVIDSVPNAAAEDGGSQSQTAASSSGGVLEMLQSLGAQTGNGAGEHSLVVNTNRNPTTGLILGSTSTPVVQPPFELDSPSAGASASIGESSEACLAFIRIF